MAMGEVPKGSGAAWGGSGKAGTDSVELPEACKPG
jgi:hypothetical protein